MGVAHGTHHNLAAPRERLAKRKRAKCAKRSRPQDAIRQQPRRFIGEHATWSYPESIIFGIDVRANLMNETARAFIRHAIRWWYAAMREIDVQGGRFVRELVMLHLSLRKNHMDCKLLVRLMLRRC